MYRDFLLPFGSFKTYKLVKLVNICGIKNLSTPFWEFHHQSHRYSWQRRRIVCFLLPFGSFHIKTLNK